jgi:hypothetical protein
MELVDTIEKVVQVNCNDDAVFYSKSLSNSDTFYNNGDQVWLYTNSDPQLLVKDKIHGFMSLNSGFIYKNNDPDGLINYYKVGDDETFYILKQNYNFNPHQKRNEYNYFFLSARDSNHNKYYYVFQLNKGLVELPKHFQLRTGRYLIDYYSNDLDVFDFENMNSIWKIKSSLVKRHKKQFPFTDGNNLFVPLDTGELLSYSLDGKQRWKWEDTTESRVGFGQTGGNVYQNYGRGFVVIDKEFGETENRLVFKKDIKGLQNFHGSGPVWCYENILVFIDMLYGKVVVLDRENYELIGYFEIGRPGIPSIWDRVHYINGKLFVHGMNNKLYVFKV